MKNRPRRLEPAIVRQIVSWLQQWNAGNVEASLTWEKVEIYSGFSRQALSKNPSIADAYAAVKVALKRGTFKIVRDDERPESDSLIASLRDRINVLEAQEQNWLALWERWKYNCRIRGWDTKLLEAEIPKPVHRRRPRH